MRKLLLLVVTALALAVAGAPAAAYADNPHAGNSGHFQGSAQPCTNDNNNPNCPPFGN